MNTLYPLLFDPNFHTTVWGGTRIKPMKGLKGDDEPVGESWEISAVPSSVSVVANGRLKGLTLSALIEQYGPLLVGKRVAEKYGRQFPLLIKFIDAANDLSIQVHPNDDMAKRYHNSLGKTEMWYVMSAEQGAKLYVGLNEDITPDIYRQKVHNGSICDVLQAHEVKKGDVFFLPAGRIHAICGGVMVAEIQQNSNVTYRIYDYNRMGLDGQPRQLHTELAAEAIDYKVYSNYRTDYQHHLNEIVTLTDCELFTVNLMEIEQPMHRVMYPYDSFVILMCLEGSCEIEVGSCEQCNDSNMLGNGKIALTQGNSCLIPASMADFTVVPRGAATLLESYCNNKDYNNI